MGLDYDKGIDLWSVAVTLFELYKGSPVLPGVNNNEVRMDGFISFGLVSCYTYSGLYGLIIEKKKQKNIRSTS